MQKSLQYRFMQMSQHDLVPSRIHHHMMHIHPHNMQAHLQLNLRIGNLRPQHQNRLQAMDRLPLVPASPKLVRKSQQRQISGIGVHLRHGDHLRRHLLLRQPLQMHRIWRHRRFTGTIVAIRLVVISRSRRGIVSLICKAMSVMRGANGRVHVHLVRMVAAWRRLLIQLVPVGTHRAMGKVGGLVVRGDGRCGGRVSRVRVSHHRWTRQVVSVMIVVVVVMVHRWRAEDVAATATTTCNSHSVHVAAVNLI